MAMILLFQKTRKRFYYFGVNEKTILLFGVGREYDFTEAQKYRRFPVLPARRGRHRLYS